MRVLSHITLKSKIHFLNYSGFWYTAWHPHVTEKILELRFPGFAPLCKKSCGRPCLDDVQVYSFRYYYWTTACVRSSLSTYMMSMTLVLSLISEPPASSSKHSFGLYTSGASTTVDKLNGQECAADIFPSKFIYFHTHFFAPMLLTWM